MRLSIFYLWYFIVKCSKNQLVTELKKTMDSTNPGNSSDLQESISQAGVSDQSSEQDYLGFEPYVIAIAEFLTNPETKPPLTISIEGEWGSGKSSFMKQLNKAIEKIERKKFDEKEKIKELTDNLKEDIEKFKKQNIIKKIFTFHIIAVLLFKWVKLRHKKSKYLPPTTVFFNAWKHDKAEALWAAFALEFFKQISKKLGIFHSLISQVKLFFNRVNKIKIIQSLFFAVVGLFILIELIVYVVSKGDSLLQEGAKFITTFLLQKQLNINLLGLRLIIYGSSLFGFVKLILRIMNIGSPKNDLIKYLKSPKYENQIEFVEEFHADFKKIVEAFAGKNKVYVFIDDLDRCEVPKSAELMQAINMMIANDPQLIFILGMDVDKVAAGIAVKHKQIIPYLAFDSSNKFSPNTSLRGIEYGYNFFEKFVQIRFQIPQPTKADFEQFLKIISPRTTQKQRILTSKQNTQQPLEETEEQIPASDEIPTPAEERSQRIEYIKLKTGEDSEIVRNIALMVASALDYNPRRWKQFINLFRLKAYIAASTNLITANAVKNNSPNRYLTLEQLGKFTAISIRWPRLVADLNTDHQLLKNLQEGTSYNPPYFSRYNEATQYWGSKQKLLELLRYPADNRPLEEKYSFANVDVETLLQISPQDDLSSEKGIDYTRLRDLLRAENWKEADSETYLVMLKAVGREERGWITEEELLNFPCTDLRTIDQLWVKYSNGHFGFSVQKEIYLSVGGVDDGKYYEEVFEKYGDEVGWRVNESWIWYKDVTNTIYSRGHLPLFEKWQLEVWFFVGLFSRIQTCKL